MAEESDKEPILTDDEIEALVEHAEEGGFDDGEFRIHDFGAGESLTLSKWVDLEGLHGNHAEALQKALSASFDIELTVAAGLSTFATAKDLSAAFPHRLCVVSTMVGQFDEECHFFLPGETLTFLVNQYFGGGSVAPPKLTAKVTPSEQRIGERVAREFLRTMAEIWVDRCPLQLGDLYVDVTPDRFSLVPGDTGFAVFRFDIEIVDEHEGVIQLLVPFDGLEAQSQAFLPRKRDARKARRRNMGAAAEGDFTRRFCRGPRLH